MNCIPAAAVVLLAALGFATNVAAQTRASVEDRGLALQIYRELVEIDTSAPDGNPGAAAEAMAARLRAAGLPAGDIEVIHTAPRLGNLVARYAGRDPLLPPILLMAHIDVVPASREDWSTDPFTLHEQDGYYYGRGAADNKAGAAMLVANFIRYRRAGLQPQRDLFIALTADEETTGAGMQWLLEHHAGVRAAVFALNTDAGESELKDDRHAVMGVQASEKVYLSYQLEVHDAGGHSSLPRSGNPIYRLARALVRLETHRFPVQLNEVTRSYLQRTAELGGPYAMEKRRVAASGADGTAIERLSGHPFYNAQLRTTCVATMLDGGHAENALPQSARAMVNCRVLPGEALAQVDAMLQGVIGDPEVVITRVSEPIESPPSPLTPALMERFERLTAAHFPGAVVIPLMAAGATDAVYVRNAGIPVYGAAATFGLPGDSRAHGRDERLLVRSFYEALDFWYDLALEAAELEGD